MARSALAAEFFVVGGPVQADRPCYVERDADQVLVESIRDQHFCYVLGPRAIGKTSLMARAIGVLRREGQLAAVVDLTQIGARTESTDAGRWYYSIAYRILRELRLKVDLQSWWQDKSALMSEQRLAEFFWDLVLAHTSVPVTVFFDEIERALELPFADQLFAAIRTCYMRRATEPDSARLNFVVLGVAAPSQLCPDVSLSPFADGFAVDLDDFTLEESVTLAQGIDGSSRDHGRAVLERIYGWTRGQPYLTQKIARGVARKGGAVADVDRVVREQFLAAGITQEEPLLNHIRAMLRQRGPHHRQALQLLTRIARRVPLYDEPGSESRTLLKLSGVVRADRDGRLDYANRIYRHVFGLRWIKSARPFEWRVAAAIAAAVVALVVLPLWYTQYLPEPHIRALTTAESMPAAENAHRRLRRLPGFGRMADELMEERVSAMARGATTMADVFTAAGVLRRLPGREGIADRLMAEFWIDQAREEMHAERREQALLFAVEAVPGLGDEARALAAELIGTDLQDLVASHHLPSATVRWEVDWASGALAAIDDTQHASRMPLRERVATQPDAADPDRRTRLTALQHVPLRRELSIDDPGPAGAFELLLALRHPAPTDLALTLEAPDGSRAALTLPADAQGVFTHSMTADDDSQLAALAGGERQGVWRLTIIDQRTGASGTLRGWGLRFDDDGSGYWDEPEQAIMIPEPLRTEQVELALGPDGRLAAVRPVGTSTGAITLWNLVDGSVLADLHADVVPERLAFTPDASRLLAMTDSTLTIWHVSERVPVAGFASEQAFALPPTLSADGAYVMVAEQDGEQTRRLSLLRTESGTLVSSFTDAADTIQWVLGTQARYLALRGPGRNVRVIDPRRGDMITQLRHERDIVRILNVPGQELLVTVDVAGELHAWPLSAQQRDTVAGRLLGTTTDAASVEIARAASVIAFEGMYGHVVVRGLDRAAIPRSLRVERTGDPVVIRLAPHGRELVTGRDTHLRVWQTGAPMLATALGGFAFDGDLTAMALDDQGRVAALGFRGGHVRVRSTSALERAPVAAETVDYIGHRGAVTSLVVGGDHSTIASGGVDGVVRLWDLASVAPAAQFMRHAGGPIYAVAVSADGRWVAGAAEQSVRVWHSADGTLANEIAVNGAALSVVFAPDSALLAVGDSAGNVFIAEPDGPPTQRSTRAQGMVRTLAFAPDGRSLASGDAAGSIQIWDAYTLEPTGPAHAFPHPVRWIRFTESGAHLLAQTDHWVHRIEVSSRALRVRDSRLLAIGVEAGAAALTADGGRLRLIGGRDTGQPLVYEIDISRPGPPVSAATMQARDWAGVLGLTIGPMGRIFAVP